MTVDVAELLDALERVMVTAAAFRLALGDMALAAGSAEVPIDQLPVLAYPSAAFSVALGTVAAATAPVNERLAHVRKAAGN